MILHYFVFVLKLFNYVLKTEEEAEEKDHAIRLGTIGWVQTKLKITLTYFPALHSGFMATH